MSELLPCPFCGGESAIESIDYIGGNEVNEFYISCNNPECGAQPDSIGMDSMDKAIKAWNTRKEQIPYHNYPVFHQIESKGE